MQNLMQSLINNFNSSPLTFNLWFIFSKYLIYDGAAGFHLINSDNKIQINKREFELPADVVTKYQYFYRTNYKHVVFHNYYTDESYIVYATRLEFDKINVIDIHSSANDNAVISFVNSNNLGIQFNGYTFRIRHDRTRMFKYNYLICNNKLIRFKNINANIMKTIHSNIFLCYASKIPFIGYRGDNDNYTTIIYSNFEPNYKLAPQYIIGGTSGLLVNYEFPVVTYLHPFTFETYMQKQAVGNNIEFYDLNSNPKYLVKVLV